ncbi:MAG: DUF2188 domain-containing protein [Oryzomicrobium sp.]|nr:DUF2188 domain-containing protein [Oryzomicrobium sp.]MCE1244916.1 DUF2188 domain-containing protein [Oryzomicrobium sp.]
MAGKNQHVVKRDDGWAVRGAGNQRDTSHHRTQSEAKRAARDIAINQRSEVLIHGENGRIRERNRIRTRPRGDDHHHAGIGFDYSRRVIHASNSVQHHGSKRLSRKGFCVRSAGAVLGYFLRTKSGQGSNSAGK